MFSEYTNRVDLFVSDLGVTELASALSRLRREGHLSAVNVRKVYTRLLDDIATGIFERVELTSEIHRTTEHRLLASGDSGLRARDALHLDSPSAPVVSAWSATTVAWPTYAGTRG